MIYKCNNCGRNYNLKPEYCECGNNSFQEVVQNFDYSSVKTDFNVGQDVDFLYGDNNFSFEKSQNFESDDILSSQNDLKKQRNSEIIAIIVFILVLLSAIIMIFSNFSALLNKSKEKTVSVEIENYIPSDVNEYWVEEDIKSTKKQNNTNSVNIDKKSEPNVISKNDVSKAEKSSKKNISKTKKNISNPQKNNSSVQSQKQEKNVKQTESVQKIVQKNETEKLKKSEQPKENTISVEEYLKYKNSLRNKLFANFPILNVQGQGVSKISFSISSEGKLLNRKFVSQSGNKSLDDAMYNMLMRVPAYYPPPSGYNGSEIVMQMEFNNGRYSFSFLN